MLKQAWRSYLTSLHPRNIKKINDSPSGYWIFYWLIIWPILMSNVNRDMGGRIGYMLMKVFPFLMMSWSNLSSRYLMSKAMFLTPIKEHERQKYINYVLYFKIGVPVILGVLIDIVWSFFWGFNIARTLAMVFIYISIGIATYICMDNVEDIDHPISFAERVISFARRDKNGKIRLAGWNIYSLIYGLLIIVGLEASDLTGEMDPISAVFIGVGLISLLVADVVIMRNQYKDVMEYATNYEFTFRVLRKTKNKR